MASVERSLPPSTTFPVGNTASQHSLPPSTTFPAAANTMSQVQHSLPPSPTFPAAGNTMSQHTLPPSTTFPVGNTSQHSLSPSTTFPVGNTSRHSLVPPPTAFPGGNITTQQSPPSSSTMEGDTAFGLDRIETIKEQMFKDAMNGKWKKVVKAYKEEPMTQDEKITRSGDTALHVAVLNGEVDIVRQLVENVKEFDTLCKKNERKNTPLHLAASLGMVEMCKCIVDKYPDNKLELMGARNKDGETPIFLSALHGHKEAFLCLHSYYPDGDGCFYRRASDGDTILHVAIKGEYFDLAYQIIHLHAEFVNFRNEKGNTPLHILAGKPSAFKSGSYLGPLELIVYHCISVDQHIKESNEHDAYDGEGKGLKWPENYRTCLTFFLLFSSLFSRPKDIFSYLGFTRKQQNKSGQPRDTENPKQVQPTPGGQSADVSKGSSAGTSEDKSSSAQEQGINNKYKKTIRHQILPPNYITLCDLFKLVIKTLLVILGSGKIKEKKKKHTWAIQSMEELINGAPDWESVAGKDPNRKSSGDSEETKVDTTGPPSRENCGSLESMVMTDMTEKILNNFPVSVQDVISDRKNIVLLAAENRQPDTDKGKKNTPILVAAKMGVAEMIEKMLNKFPVAIHDTNSDGKNVVLLAVENRQRHVYQLLLKRKILRDSVFRKLDKDGNNALHLAAMLGQHRPWHTPGAALQMQWEIKWYKFVKSSMQSNFFVHQNNEGMTPKEVFTNTHKGLVNLGQEWLTHMSESCSAIAAVIATVAFATAANVPGGLKENTGAPMFKDKPAFGIFAFSSLVALCFSVTAMIIFLSFFTSRFRERDFGSHLPKKFIVGLITLFISIASMFVSFCFGHLLVLKEELKYAMFPVYAVVVFFALVHFPMYVDLIHSTFKKVPQRSYKVVPV